MARIHRSKSQKQNPLKNQRKFKDYKQVLWVMFARGMFGEPRPPAGTLRSESPGPICLRTKGMVGIINKIWGALQEGWLATISDSSFSVRYQLCLLRFPMCKGISAPVLSPLRLWTSLAEAFSAMGGLVHQ